MMSVVATRDYVNATRKLKPVFVPVLRDLKVILLFYYFLALSHFISSLFSATIFRV